MRSASTVLVILLLLLAAMPSEGILAKSEPMLLICDSFYLQLNGIQGSNISGPFYLESEESLVSIDAFPKAPISDTPGLEDHDLLGRRETFQTLLVMPYVAGRHDVQIERKGGYWLIRMDSRLLGAAVFSLSGMRNLADEDMEIPSLSVYVWIDEVMATWLTMIPGVRYLACPGGISEGLFETTILVGATLDYVWPFADGQYVRGSWKGTQKSTYHIDYRYASEVEWDNICNVALPTSLMLDLSAPKMGKEKVLSVLRQLPDTLRFLEVRLSNCWDFRDEVATILSTKNRILSLGITFARMPKDASGSFRFSLTGQERLLLGFDSSTVIDMGSPSSACLPTGLFAHPDVVLSGDLGSVTVLEMQGGRLLLDSLKGSGIHDLALIDTWLACKDAKAIAFSPRRVWFTPGRDEGIADVQASRTFYGQMLRRASEIYSCGWPGEIPAEEPFPNVKFFRGISDGSQVDGIPLAMLGVVFPQIEELTLRINDRSPEHITLSSRLQSLKRVILESHYRWPLVRLDDPPQGGEVFSYCPSRAYNGHGQFETSQIYLYRIPR
ncbi:MAG: hypothetical protein WC712_00830 [Candidatus Brocadiia bacterium]